MSHARLTHNLRPTLDFHMGQSDEHNRSAVANITSELGTDRTSLVHTETREAERQIRGRVSAPRRAQNDSSTNDWRQSLANYADLLESHVDEFQGDGYQLVDDNLGLSLSSILESVEWSLSTGSPYAIEYTANVLVGRGTFESRDIVTRSPTVRTGMSTMLEIDGEPLPGMRDYRVNRSVGLDPKAIFNRSSAENNDIVSTAGVEQRVVFEGTITGSQSVRESKDAALDAKVATKDPLILKTQFPGYGLSGYVTRYDSVQETRFGEKLHHYRFEFVEGQRA